MNGLAEDARALAGALKARAEGAQLACDLLVCPPFPHLGLVAQALAGSRIAVGGQSSEEHTSELQSLMRISYAVFCLKKKIVGILIPPANADGLYYYHMI